MTTIHTAETGPEIENPLTTGWLKTWLPQEWLKDAVVVDTGDLAVLGKVYKIAPPGEIYFRHLNPTTKLGRAALGIQGLFHQGEEPVLVRVLNQRPTS